MGPAIVVSVRGIPTRMRLTTLGALVLVVAGAASTLEHGQSAELVAGVLAAAILVACLLLHALTRATALQCQALGVRRIELALFGGWLRIDPRAGRPRSEAAVGLAGPALLALLVGTAALAERSLAGGITHDAARLVLVGLTSVWVIQSLPAPPLDGGRLFRALVWFLTDDPISALRATAVYGQFIAVGMIVAGCVLVPRGGPAPYWGFGAIFAGIELGAACFASMKEALVQRAMAAITLADIDLPPTRRVLDSASVEAVVDALIDEGDGAVLQVATDDGRVIGLITLSSIRRVRRTDWAERRARDVMTALSGIPRIPAELAAVDAIAEVERLGVPLVLVDDRRRVIAVRREQLWDLLARRAMEAELERRRARSGRRA